MLTHSGTESGSDDAVVASGTSVFVTSTYGYPYPALPADAGPSRPADAPFTGGITRVDLLPGGAGCTTVWDSPARSATVPRLSLADGKIYIVTRAGVTGSDKTSPLDGHDYTVLNADTGRVDTTERLGTGIPFDTLQLAPTIVPGRVIYQGTTTGLFRIGPA